MSKIGQIERATQDRVIALFRDCLGYDFLGNWADRTDNRNIEKALLSRFLSRQGYRQYAIKKAIDELIKISEDQVRSLYDINKEIYGLLRYGVNVSPETGENKETVWLVDWKIPNNNHFLQISDHKQSVAPAPSSHNQLCW